MFPHTLLDQIMLNLNYETVQKYKENVNITKKFTGGLRKLVDIEFPDEIDAPHPPIFREVEDEFYEPGISQDSDNSEESECDRRLTLIRMLIRSMREVDKSFV